RRQAIRFSVRGSFSSDGWSNAKQHRFFSTTFSAPATMATINRYVLTLGLSAGKQVPYESKNPLFPS
ncbi:MAG TPA: hypothetical protein VGY66_06010, partial [Gemmataceae bacterium]|nr:hypothetical protein [Gemmataceae bacterium]